MATPAALYGRALQLHRTPFPAPKCTPSPRSAKATRARPRRRTFVSASLDHRVDMAENSEGIISGEWTENFSLLSYDDLRAFLVPQIYRDQMCPSAQLGKVMDTVVPLATADQEIEEIKTRFEAAPAVAVVDDDCRCIGIITSGDVERIMHGMVNPKVGEVMSTPVVTLTPEKTVMDAAALMLKMKVHKIPILNENNQVIGIVTRSDIFRCLEHTEFGFDL